MDGPPRSLHAAVESVLTIYGEMSAVRAAEETPRLTRRVAAEITKNEAETAEAGGFVYVRLIGTTADRIVGYCYALPTESAEVVAVRAQRGNALAILKQIRSLTFDQFELFGARFLSELGVKTSKVTRHSNDQGIDFFGEFSFGQIHAAPEPFLMLAKDVRLLFAGQAKHYPERSLGPSVVRELVGAVALARTKTHSKDGIDLFENLPIRPFTPIVAMLFTTGEITRGANHLAASAGVVAKTGLQLAVFLADRGVGMRDDAGQPVFCAAEFDIWLRT